MKKVFEVLAPSENLSRPRVNINTGAIVARFKIQNKKIPSSILGYVDWLYSRRNAIVHGGGNVAMLQNDLKHLKDCFHCDVAKNCETEDRVHHECSRVFPSCGEALERELEFVTRDF